MTADQDNARHHSKAVKAAARALNDEITKAVEAGLEVRLEVDEAKTDKGTKPQAVVRLWQEIH